MVQVFRVSGDSDEIRYSCSRSGRVTLQNANVNSRQQGRGMASFHQAHPLQYQIEIEVQMEWLDETCAALSWRGEDEKGNKEC